MLLCHARAGAQWCRLSIGGIALKRHRRLIYRGARVGYARFRKLRIIAVQLVLTVEGSTKRRDKKAQILM